MLLTTSKPLCSASCAEICKIILGFSWALSREIPREPCHSRSIGVFLTDPRRSPFEARDATREVTGAKRGHIIIPANAKVREADSRAGRSVDEEIARGRLICRRNFSRTFSQNARRCLSSAGKLEGKIENRCGKSAASTWQLRSHPSISKKRRFPRKQ